MKKAILPILLLVMYSSISTAQNLSPYFKLGIIGQDIEQTKTQLIATIENSDYEIIGSYAPGNQTDLLVIVMTNEETRSLCSSTTQQGLIAAPYRLGLEKTETGVALTTVNPDYQWRAYLTESYSTNAEAFNVLRTKYMNFVKSLGSGQAESFGGSQDADDLEDYHYMFGMPYYEDQVTIKTFDSYSQATNTIENKLKDVEGIQHVFTLKDDQKQVAVFGIGLVDNEIGESHFLSIIGQSHVAALPYELIVEGNKVKMLHGRFRFALYWPELTMGTFTKIMSTPGDVESMMERLVE
jgi:hypothetical protein